MTRSDLIDAMAEGANISRHQATRALDALTARLIGALGEGEKVTLLNFGAFTVVQRAARPGLHPKTGESIEIPAQRVVRFKPGKGLKDALAR
ncbi:MAG: HU family DNA-binding protein [Alphaproteobacteria bacterium]|nr:HU family DNA-binding protein [Alphaproteobacteria bacterium]